MCAIKKDVKMKVVFTQYIAHTPVKLAQALVVAFFFTDPEGADKNSLHSISPIRLSLKKA